MKFRTEKARELKRELDALNAEYKKEEARCHDVYVAYCRMEGMYGKIAHDPWDDGMGQRGFHYEYATEQLFNEELAEREQFLKDNNYKSPFTVYEEYRDKIDVLEEAFSQEQYGMSLAKKKLADLIKKQERAIKEAEKALEYERKRLKEFCEKFEKTS